MPNLGLSEFPPLAKALAGVLLVGGAASHVKPIRAALGLVAARATARPWTLLSCAFLSDSIVSVSSKCRIRVCMLRRACAKLTGLEQGRAVPLPAGGGGFAAGRVAHCAACCDAAGLQPQTRWHRSPAAGSQHHAVLALPRPNVQPSHSKFFASLLQALAYAVAVLFLARIVEPIHGARELLKYLSAVIMLTSCLTVAVRARPG